MATYSARLALLTALTCAGLLATALYMEYVSGLVPCALCLAQRATFALIGIAMPSLHVAILHVATSFFRLQLS